MMPVAVELKLTQKGINFLSTILFMAIDVMFRT